jgi:hypothetical protein
MMNRRQVVAYGKQESAVIANFLSSLDEEVFLSMYMLYMLIFDVDRQA